MKQIRNILFLSLAFLALSCGNEKVENSENSEDNKAQNQIIISQAQFDENKMELAKATLQPFPEKIACKGKITATINGYAKVTPFVSGKIITIDVMHGQLVSKGATICNIASTQFIDLQQSYAEAVASFVKIKADYERAKSLREDNIGSEKNFIALQSEYNSANISLKAMQAKLQQMGINSASIEKGEIQGSYKVVAPIGGYVSDITAVLGQFVAENSEIAEIINSSQTQLSLYVFEDDIYSLRKGHAVQFTVAGDTIMHNAQLQAIGRSVNPDTKTVHCIASIEPTTTTNFVNDAFVQANIITSTATYNALPITAFVKSEGVTFIYLFSDKKDGNYYFEKKAVKITHVHGNYATFAEPFPTQEVLVKGGSTL